MIDVIGFGALNADQLYSVDKIASHDDESFIKNFTQTCGGSAANTCTGLSRLGLKTSYIGKIAEDNEGKLLKNNLYNENINLENLIISKNGRTGKVMGFVDSKGERALYVDAGVNDTIKISEINLKKVNEAKLLHLSSFVGESFNTQIELVKQISKKVKLSFDPGMIYVNKGLNNLVDILNRTNILLLNHKELEILLNKKIENIPTSLNPLWDLGIKTIIIKQGSKGASAFQEDQNIMVPAFNVKCVDTTGAGDAFNAGFIYSYLNGENLKESCLFGNKVAAFSVKKIGATTALPYLKDLN